MGSYNILLSSIVRYIGGFVLLYLAHFLYRGLLIRLRFRKLRAQGLPVPDPYSILLGHIPLMKILRQGLPGDARDTYVVRRLSLEWQQYFSTATKSPPLAYLDLWPFLSQPLIVVFTPQACSQLTQETPQPRHSLFKWSLTPLTGGKDLTSVDMSTHRAWRLKLNPGFSSKNLISQTAILLSEVSTFAQKLKDKAGDRNTWGDLFTLYDDAVSLTFDIILQSTLGYQTNEQTNSLSPLFRSIRRLTTHVKKPNLITRLERCLPPYLFSIYYHNKIVNELLWPHIKARLKREPEAGGRKTVVDLCLADIPAESQDKKALYEREEYINVVLSQVKVFILAGHHTTSQAICWVLYEIYKNTTVLDQLRTEHDQVLGSHPRQAHEILSGNPHKLKDLRYTTAVIKETLRIHALGQTHREGSATFKFSLDGVVYPTDDAIIQTVPAATQSSPELWHRAAEFLPERFLVAAGDELYPTKNAWRPFELGTTRCIGEELAMMEIKLVLVLVLRDLDFEFGLAGEESQQKRKDVPDTVDGNRIYRVGNGLCYVKDNLPTRVRLRPS